MKNRLWRVLRGDSYLYRYRRAGEEAGAAVVEIRRAPVVGWVVNEAMGPRNEELLAEDRGAILSAFAEAGIPAAPQVTSHFAEFWLE
jgi:hypothetical protein